MHNFALELMEQVRGIQSFQKLVVDGKAPFDSFVDELEVCYEGELDGIFNYMNCVANNLSVPREKFHLYNDGKDGCREFEFKSKHLRVYVIEQKNGKFVVTGGTKANQNKDQQFFRKLKREYLNSL